MRLNPVLQKPPQPEHADNQHECHEHRYGRPFKNLARKGTTAFRLPDLAKMLDTDVIGPCDTGMIGHRGKFRVGMQPGRIGKDARLCPDPAGQTPTRAVDLICKIATLDPQPLYHKRRNTIRHLLYRHVIPLLAFADYRLGRCRSTTGNRSSLRLAKAA